MKMSTTCSCTTNKRTLNISFGDRWRDIDAGKKIGCKTIFVDRKYNEELNNKPDYTVEDLKKIMDII